MERRPLRAFLQSREWTTIQWGFWGAFIGMALLGLPGLAGFTYIFVNLSAGTPGGVTGNIEASRFACTILAGFGAVAGAIVGVVTAATRTIVDAINRPGSTQMQPASGSVQESLGGSVRGSIQDKQA
jgi:hypothetical protein